MTIRVSAGREEGERLAPDGKPPARIQPYGRPADAPAETGALADVERLLEAAETIASPVEAVRRLRRAAAMLEGSLEDPARAFEVLELAFRRLPGDADVVTQLERLAEPGRWERLVNLAEEVMLEVDEPETLGQLWARVARWTRRLGRWEQALAAGENAQALAPNDEIALLELEEIYRHLGHQGPLARVLARRAHGLSRSGAAQSRHDLLDIHLELAALYEGPLGDDEQAIAASERAFALDPQNVAALARLERLAEKNNRRTLLVDVLDRRLAIAPSPAEKTALAMRLAAAWESLGRADNACRVLGAILAEGREEPDVLRALSRLYRESGEFESLSQILERLLALNPPRDEARAITRELGEIYARTLNRPENAERHLERVFAEDPSDAGVARLLSASLGKRREWSKLGEVLMRAGTQAAAAGDRLTFLREAARLYGGRLADRAVARTALGLILEHDPTDAEALTELLGEASSRGDWPGVKELIGKVLPQAASLPPVRAAELHDWLARAAEAQGDRAAVLEHRRLAATVAPDHHGHRRLAADLLVAEGHLTEALPHLEWLWEHPEGRHSDATRGELAHNLGRARLAHGDRAGATTAFQQAVQLAPQHQAALEALASLAVQDGEAAAAVRHKEQLLRVAEDPARRVALATELARIYQEDLGDRARAIRALKDGLALVPGSHQLLHALLDLQVSGRFWRDALDTLLSLAEASEGSLRAKYLATAGRIADHKLQSHEEAAALFGRALDADPLSFDLFARLERLLTERRAFSAQAQAYRTMIARLQNQEGDSVTVARRSLWRGLGEIYRSRLDDPKSAVTAFETAAELNPDDQECRIIVTELYEIAGPETWGRAVADRRRLLGRSSSVDDMASHLRALHRLGVKMNQLDQAFRASEGLVATGVATPEERAFHQRHALPATPPTIPLTDNRWHKVRHEEQDPRLSLAFSAVGRAMLVARGRAARAWGLTDESPSEREESERSILAQLVADLTSMMGAPQPRLRFRPDLPGTVDLAGVVARTHVEPTLVAGADMLQVRSKREILSLVAKTATRLRWEHLVLWPTVVPTLNELQVAVLALRRLFDHKPLAPLRWSDQRVVSRYAESLRKGLTVQEFERLAGVAGELDPAGVVRWVRGAVMTTGRAGLLAGGDLGVAIQLARPETYGQLTVQPFEQARDLIIWNVSEEHLSLRRDLGLPTLDSPEIAGALPAISSDEVSVARERRRRP